MIPHSILFHFWNKNELTASNKPTNQINGWNGMSANWNHSAALMIGLIDWFLNEFKIKQFQQIQSLIALAEWVSILAGFSVIHFALRSIAHSILSNYSLNLFWHQGWLISVACFFNRNFNHQFAFWSHFWSSKFDFRNSLINRNNFSMKLNEGKLTAMK